MRLKGIFLVIVNECLACFNEDGIYMMRIIIRNGLAGKYIVPGYK